MKRKYIEPKKELANLIYEVKKAEEELFDARDMLGYVVDAQLIDYYIYQVNALEKKYEYLLKQVKEIC